MKDINHQQRVCNDKRIARRFVEKKKAQAKEVHEKMKKGLYRPEFINTEMISDQGKMEAMKHARHLIDIKFFDNEDLSYIENQRTPKDELGIWAWRD